MPFKKIPNGDYYYFSKSRSGTEFIVKYLHPGNPNAKVGQISVTTTCPKELVGKRVRLKLELA